jgi:hypothetical protein
MEHTLNRAGPRRLAAVGLVPITRASPLRLYHKSGCRILSYAQGRFYAGSWQGPQPSQYCAHLGGAFAYRMAGLTGAEQPPFKPLWPTCNDAGPPHSS